MNCRLASWLSYHLLFVSQLVCRQFSLNVRSERASRPVARYHFCVCVKKLASRYYSATCYHLIQATFVADTTTTILIIILPQFVVSGLRVNPFHAKQHSPNIDLKFYPVDRSVECDYCSWLLGSRIFILFNSYEPVPRVFITHRVGCDHNLSYRTLVVCLRMDRFHWMLCVMASKSTPTSRMTFNVRLCLACKDSTNKNK